MFIMDANDYVTETKRQLKASENCKVLAKDRTATKNNLVDQTIDRFKKEQLINENIANRLQNQSPKTP